MNYESAWLNSSVKPTVAEISAIENIYLITERDTNQSENCIIDTALCEAERAATELFGHKAEKKQNMTIAQVYSRQKDNANIVLHLLNNESNNCRVGEYRIKTEPENKVIFVEASSAVGLLYGVFKTEFDFKTKKTLAEFDELAKPASPMRMLNHWDNMDGTIERGYSGQSFFFSDNKVIVNDRTEAYARMIASVGINACVINNVNVRAEATMLITPKHREQVKKIASIFASYGIDLYLSLNFAAPMELGGLDNCDPCNEKVVEWWKTTLDELFSDVKELKGFLIKADSEGRPGPFTYGRNHAEGANMLADIIAPYGGKIIWRCFVYNCKQDWRDTVTDRARAQYDNFKPLDGLFRENVILQVKNGPMDFQVREPVSPLLGGMNSTNEMIEFQIAQEYTGQQKHVCYLIPQFKEVLEYKTYIKDKNQVLCEKDTVCDIVTGETFGNVNCGMAAVTNTGDDANWTGHDLAAANLFGFGRLSFNPELTAEEIEREWIALTFGNDDNFFNIISYILNTSWPAYEKYNAPLGVGWMVNPSHHYGPNVDGYEFSEWGTYHRADAEGMGVERSSKGTGYTGQYNEPNRSMYENLETCPDELLLFMHHVPYTYRLHSGKTVIQHIYDTHYEGAEDAEKMLEAWKQLEGLADKVVYERVLERLNIQVASAYEWRDHINGYFRNKSGIPDEKGRI